MALLYGFTKRALWSALAVAAIGQTTLLVLAEWAPEEWSSEMANWAALGAIVYVVSMVRLRRLTEADRNDVVTAATVVVANAFAFAVIVLMFGVAVEDERRASYADIATIMFLAFVGLLIGFHRLRRRQLQAAAVTFAEEAHRDQTRKGTDVP